MNKPSIIITGSQGRIGKILIENLSKVFNFWGIDKITSPATTASYSTVDISDAKKLEAIFEKAIESLVDIQTVIHLAANGNLDASWESVLCDNIIGTKNIYECVRKFHIPKIIFASTNHVTGCYEKNGFPQNMICASDPIRPDSDYASSKVFGEALAREYQELYGINSVCLRIGSILEDDNQTKNSRLMHTWLSHRDLLHLFRKSIESSIKFGVYYGVSNNDGRFWDIANAERELGYNPVDNAALYLKKD